MAGSITKAQWLQQYATRSQVEGVLGQRDRLLLERSKLEAVADAARAVGVAYAKRHDPSGDFGPKIAHLEQYVDTCWELLKPMIELKRALRSLDALDEDEVVAGGEEAPHYDALLESYDRYVERHGLS